MTELTAAWHTTETDLDRVLAIPNIGFKHAFMVNLYGADGRVLDSKDSLLVCRAVHKNGHLTIDRYVTENDSMEILSVYHVSVTSLGQKSDLGIMMDYHLKQPFVLIGTELDTDPKKLGALKLTLRAPVRSTFIRPFVEKKDG